MIIGILFQLFEYPYATNAIFKPKNVAIYALFLGNFLQTMRGREDDIVFHIMLLCYCDDGRHGKRDDQYCDILEVGGAVDDQYCERRATGKCMLTSFVDIIE